MAASVADRGLRERERLRRCDLAPSTRISANRMTTALTDAARRRIIPAYSATPNATMAELGREFALSPGTIARTLQLAGIRELQRPGPISQAGDAGNDALRGTDALGRRLVEVYGPWSYPMIDSMLGWAAGRRRPDPAHRLGYGCHGRLVVIVLALPDTATGCDAASQCHGTAAHDERSGSLLASARLPSHRDDGP